MNVFGNALNVRNGADPVMPVERRTDKCNYECVWEHFECAQRDMNPVAPVKRRTDRCNYECVWECFECVQWGWS